MPGTATRLVPCDCGNPYPQGTMHECPKPYHYALVALQHKFMGHSPLHERTR
jgi:hypothetical protein